MNIHQKNIIHRDLKLENILLDNNWDPKICDFGISNIWNGNPIYDNESTLPYISPEVIMNEGKISLKTDIWALGVIFYILSFG